MVRRWFGAVSTEDRIMQPGLVQIVRSVGLVEGIGVVEKSLPGKKRRNVMLVGSSGLYNY